MDDAFRALLAAVRGSSDEVLSVLDRCVSRLEPAIDATLFFTVDADVLHCRRARGPRARVLRAASVPLRGPSLVNRAALVGEPATLRARSERVLPGDRAAIAVPIVSDRAVRAVWCGCAPERIESASRVSALVAAGGDAYLLALERERDREAATFDALTGVLAPRAFRARLFDELARERDRALSLWFVDTDRFKQINDDLGHAAGDAVLQRMAALLSAHAVPGIDDVGRKGGDEFCVLLRGSRKRSALERAAAFRGAVRAEDFGLPFRVTASIGVAAFPFDALDASSLLEAADAAMYHAKRAGRDRVAYAVEGAGFALYE